MPSEDHGLFCLVAAHLLRNAHRYFNNLDRPSEIQMQLLEEKTITEVTRQRLIDEFKAANKKLRVIGDLKDKNRIAEQKNWFLR